MLSLVLQFLNWKFGSSLEEEALQVGFCMQFMPDADVTNLQWVYEGEHYVAYTESPTARLQICCIAENLVVGLYSADACIL